MAKTKKSKKTDPIVLEAKIRKYVKRNGGFRKDLPDEQLKAAKALLKDAGRKADDGWDPEIDLGMINMATAIA